MKKLAMALVLLSIIQLCMAQQLHPTTVQEINAKVVVKGSGTVTGSLNGDITLRVLSFQESEEQKLIWLEETLEINGKKITAKKEIDEHGNRYAVFEFREMGDFTYTIEAEVHKAVQPVGLTDYNLSKEISEHGEYLQQTEKIESGNAGIRTLALNKFDSDSWLETVAEVTNWVHNYVEYDMAYYPEVYSATQTLNSKKGTCDEFANLTAAILRAKGIPVRVVAGPVFSAQEWNSHGWIEAFNPNVGWVPIDSTFGEAGMVDATHIETGKFADFGQATDTIRHPSTASVELSGKAVESVEVLSTKLFEGIVLIDADDKTIYANSWQDIDIEVENKQNRYLIVPLSISGIQGFEFEEQDKVLLFQPRERRTVTWKTLVQKDMAKNQYLTGKYNIISIHPIVEAELKVLPASLQAESQYIEVTDLIALVKGNALKIEIVLENKGGAENAVEITVESLGKELARQEETIMGFGKKNIILTIDDFTEETHTVKVVGKSSTYVAEILPQQESQPKVEEKQPEPSPEQPPAETEETPIEQEEMPLTPEMMAIAGVGFVAAIVLAVLLKNFVFT